MRHLEDIKRDWIAQGANVSNGPDFANGDLVMITNQMPLDSGGPYYRLDQASLGCKGFIKGRDDGFFTKRRGYCVVLGGGLVVSCYHEWLIKVEGDIHGS